MGCSRETVVYRGLTRTIPSYRRRALLWDQPKKFKGSVECIEKNAEFFKAMLHEFQKENVPSHLHVEAQTPGEDQRVSPGDADKVRYVLKNLVRDWSEEGELERSQSHKPILEVRHHILPSILDESFPVPLSPLLPTNGRPNHSSWHMYDNHSVVSKHALTCILKCKPSYAFSNFTPDRVFNHSCTCSFAFSRNILGVLGA